jgi:hypothetical protein
MSELFGGQYASRSVPHGSRGVNGRARRYEFRIEGTSVGGWRAVARMG